MSTTTVLVKELRISVERGRVVTTLNIIKHYISYLGPVYTTVEKSTGHEKKGVSQL
jgi:hypothetical protein